MLQLISFFFSIYSTLLPQMASKTAFQMFQTVRKKSIRPREQPFYDMANKQTIPFQTEDLNLYTFGDKEQNDVVVLVHGWESNAGCFTQFIPELIKKKKYIMSINLPGHGDYKNNKSNVFVSQQALQALLKTIPQEKNISIISHSFGSAVTAYALSKIDISIDKIFYLTTPNQIKDIFDEFKALIQLSDKAYELFNQKAEEILGEPIESTTIQQKLQHANYNHLYLLHDQFDKVVPFKNAEDIHQSSPQSTLYPFENIGHYRMLWNDELIAKVVENMQKQERPIVKS